MKKDIEWLKEAVGELNLVDTVFEADGVSYIDTAVSVTQVYDLIDQLDEPEVLSQELPVIPKYVADWHKQNKYYLLSAKFERIADWEDERVVEWYENCSGRHNNKRANAQEVIALMDLVGYEVEKEKLYIVQLPTNLEDDLIILDADGDIWKDSWPSRYKMTEKRIKEIDERYWPFAKEVAE